MRDANLDLNLLLALDVLLEEGSVTGAALRLGLSSSAMSRALTRLRTVTGDPLLVRAGRGLVATPHAEALRQRVHDVALEARDVLRPRTTHVDPTTLDLAFTIRASEAFLEMLAGPVVAVVARAAPKVRLRFAAKPDKDARPLREGPIDLEIGVLGTSAPEIRTQVLLQDRFMGVARAGHPILATGSGLTVEEYAACGHVVACRHDDPRDAVDEALAGRGLTRRVLAIVPGYPDALRIARQTDLLALVPRSCLGNPMRDGPDPLAGLAAFVPPLPLADFKISAMWHPRLDADPAHRWLRHAVMSVCRAAYPPGW